MLDFFEDVGWRVGNEEFVEWWEVEDEGCEEQVGRGEEQVGLVVGVDAEEGSE